MHIDLLLASALLLSWGSKVRCSLFLSSPFLPSMRSRSSVALNARYDGMLSSEFCHPVVVIIVNEGELGDWAPSVLAITSSFDRTEGTIFGLLEQWTVVTPPQLDPQFTTPEEELKSSNHVQTMVDFTKTLAFMKKEITKTFAIGP